MKQTFKKLLEILNCTYLLYLLCLLLVVWSTKMITGRKNADVKEFIWVIENEVVQVVDASGLHQYEVPIQGQ